MPQKVGYHKENPLTPREALEEFLQKFMRLYGGNKKKLRLIFALPEEAALRPEFKQRLMDVGIGDRILNHMHKSLPKLTMDDLTISITREDEPTIVVSGDFATFVFSVRRGESFALEDPLTEDQHRFIEEIILWQYVLSDEAITEELARGYKELISSHARRYRISQEELCKMLRIPAELKREEA